MNPCIFCKIIEREIPAEILFETDKILCFLSIQPTNPGHALVIHKHHHVDIFDTPETDLGELMAGAKTMAQKLIDAKLADGVNIGMNNKSAAGQVIFHAHVHVIPRLSTDGLKHWAHKDATKEQLQSVAEKLRTSIS